MVMTRMPPMRALVGVPPQSGKPGLRLAAALRTARGRGARSVRRTRRLRAGQCSAKSVWTAVLEGAAAGGNDLWRGGACGARWCSGECEACVRRGAVRVGGAGTAAGGSVAMSTSLDSRSLPPRALGKAKAKTAANSLRAASTSVQRPSPLSSTATITSKPPPAHRPPPPQFSDPTVNAARHDGLCHQADQQGAAGPAEGPAGVLLGRTDRRRPLPLAVDDHGAGARSPPPSARSAAASARRGALTADPLTARAAAPAPAEGLAVRERHLLPQHPLPHRLPI